MIGPRIVSALVDGDRVAWREAARLADTPRERQIVADLRWLDAVSSTALDRGGQTVRANLPVWAGMAFVWAQCQIAVGLVTLAAGRTHASRFILFQILLVLSFEGAGALLVLAGRRDIRARWLALVYVLTAASFAHAFMSPTIALTRVFAHTPVEAFIPAAVWRFAQKFPRSEQLSQLDRWLNRMAALALATGVALLGVNLLLLVSPALQQTVLGNLDRSDSRWQFWAVVYPLALPGLAMPMLRAVHASPDERRRVWQFTAVLACGMTPIIASGLTEHFAPSIASLWTSSNSARAALDRAVLGTLLLVPPASTFAIVARQALTLRLVVQRATHHVLARWSLVALTLVPTLLLAGFLYQHREAPLSVVMSGGRGRLLLVWLTLACAAQLARGSLLSFVDRVFGRGAATQARDLGASIAALRGAVGATHVLGLLSERVHRMFGSHTAVLRLDADGGAAPLYGESQPLGGASAIIAIAREAREPLVFHGRDSIRSLLPPEDRAWSTTNGVDVVLPLGRSDGQVVALFAVKERADRFEWSREDVNWLSALADAAALALDSAWRETEQMDAGRDWHASECRLCGRVQVPAGQTCSCGGPLGPSLLPVMLHGRYAVERVAGRGGMGVVYRGRDVGLDRPVALKTLPLLEAEAAARIRAEARAMGSLAHPHVATIYAIEVWQRTPVLVLEWLDGGTLAERLRSRGPLDADEALHTCCSIARALAALHSAGFVHGDVKPSNVGFMGTGVPKLLDFGLTQVGASAAGETPSLAGTPAYLPPEAYAGQPQAASFDLWALSVVLFETLTGINPFSAGTLTEVKARVRAGVPPDVRRWRANVPQPLAEGLQTGLHPVPESRPGSAEAWLALFDQTYPSTAGRPAWI